MTHVDEVALVALRDGESVDPAVAAHVAACVPCRHALADARARARAIEELLSQTAVGSPGGHEVERAKAGVRARLDAQRARERRTGGSAVHLRRAAAMLLVAAGAASALSGSPVRVWLGIDPVEPSAHDAAVATPPVSTTPPGETVVLIPAADGIDIELTQVVAGSEVELNWLTGTSAQLAGGPGARYTVGEGHAQAAAPNGPVQLGIPRSALHISITINGRRVYSGTSEEADVGDVVRRSPGGLVFTVPAS